jgi:hypothetical protein
VDLHLRHTSHVPLLLGLISIFSPRDTLKETEGLQDVLYMWMSLQACRGSVCSLPHVASVMCSYLEQSI